MHEAKFDERVRFSCDDTLRVLKSYEIKLKSFFRN